jgi:Asp-tRNA(Asn)/Glu-tRNA(Gln) amidotransferase A subunit family amidase
MLESLTIPEAALRIRSGRLAPGELVDRCLDQIHRHDERVRAWVLVDEEGAKRAADELGREAARGEFRGPLHGIPLGIKDIIDVAGWPTRAGSPLREGHVAKDDAPVVATLRRAGAILLGKTVTVEFACFDPSPTRNPWNLQHTPGGSSSGSAAAVAMGMCLGAVGTQTGGSLVRPATYCGIATCKPTFGRISTEGIVPVSYHLDCPGPMARHVADLAVLLGCLLETDAIQLGQDSAPPRLGLLQQFFMEEADEEILAVTEEALDKFRAAGAHIEPVRLPEGFSQVRGMHRRIMAVEAAAYHREQFTHHREKFGPLISGLLDEGSAILGVDFATALEWQRGFRQRVTSLFSQADVLVMPSTDDTAPDTLATTGTPKFQAPWSCAGLPVVSIPCGLAVNGLPAAVQLVGLPNHESELLQVAQWCERQIAFHTVPPLWRA